MLIGRDAHGNRPVYWGCSTEGQLLVSSDPQALAQCEPSATPFPSGCLFMSMGNVIGTNTSDGWVMEAPQAWPGRIFSFVHSTRKGKEFRDVKVRRKTPLNPSAFPTAPSQPGHATVLSSFSLPGIAGGAPGRLPRVPARLGLPGCLRGRNSQGRAVEARDLGFVKRTELRSCSALSSISKLDSCRCKINRQ